mgnify:CR=1 FL=1
MIDARTLLEALETMHTRETGWVFVPELRFGTGYGPMKEQRIDAWAIRCWSTSGLPNLRRSFELKINPADITGELRNPDKRWAAYAISHEFYFVTPAGLINPNLLTEDDGLMEYFDRTEAPGLKITKPPRVRETMPPRWDFVASLARRLRGHDIH